MDKAKQLVLYAGGNIVKENNGVSYDRQAMASLSVSRDASYEQLLDCICNRLKINRTTHRVKLLQGVVVGHDSNMYTDVVPVDDEDAVQELLVNTKGATVVYVQISDHEVPLVTAQDFGYSGPQVKRQSRGKQKTVLQKYVGRGKRKTVLQKYVIFEEKDCWKCNFCRRRSTSRPNRIIAHLIGIEGKGIKRCPELKEAGLDVDGPDDNNRGRKRRRETNCNLLETQDEILSTSVRHTHDQEEEGAYAPLPNASSELLATGQSHQLDITGMNNQPETQDEIISTSVRHTHDQEEEGAYAPLPNASSELLATGQSHQLDITGMNNQPETQDEIISTSVRHTHDQEEEGAYAPLPNASSELLATGQSHQLDITWMNMDDPIPGPPETNLYYGWTLDDGFFHDDELLLHDELIHDSVLSLDDELFHNDALFGSAQCVPRPRPRPSRLRSSSCKIEFDKKSSTVPCTKKFPKKRGMIMKSIFFSVRQIARSP